MLRKILDGMEKAFNTKKSLKRWFPLFEAMDTFLYTPGTVTKLPPHVRDFLDLKRMMATVVLALVPAAVVGIYNVGLQANIGIAAAGQAPVDSWRLGLLSWSGIGFASHSFPACFIHGLLYFIPVYAVTLVVGGFWEVIFAVIRKHPIAEGFFVTSLLIPMIMPPTIPLWMVAVGISFGVVMGKEVFGGVGMNIINPALAARLFLFFAYPAQFSGDKVYVAADGFSRATALAEMADTTLQSSITWMDAFLGFIPGVMGETSALACLAGALILVVTGIGSWRIMASAVLGMVIMAAVFNFIGSSTNPMFSLSPMWHLVLGGFMFGTVFMATDPVSGAQTNQGRYVYGLLIGILTVLIRVINPAYPEGIMLAILFCNLLAPVIDRVFINANIRRRRIHYGLRQQ